MPGLPGDTADGFIEKTVEAAIGLQPHFVRLYPALVIKDTPLAKLYQAGRYAPLPLDEAVALCRAALFRFEQAGIAVVRMGLQPAEDLERPGTILAGPYHPAFRQLVESFRFLEEMRKALAEGTGKDAAAVILVNPGEISSAIGQRRSNVNQLKKQFGLRTVRIVPDASIPKKTVKLL
jgi:histone acetyltransferase (RNA polymerase elongator complex component)